MHRSCWLVLVFGSLIAVAVFGQQLEIHHIDVGQADATLIKSPTGVTMLIDAGNDGDGTSIVLPYLTSLGITHLNYVACSHYHADHLGGLDEVINGFGISQIDSVYDRGNGAPLPATQVYSKYVTAANAIGRRHAVALGYVLDLGGGASMKCVATDGKVINYGTVSGASGSENDLSIGWVLTYKSFRYFTGGDLGGESSTYADSETPLGPEVGDVDVMKVNHHGSAYSTNQTFLNNLKPEVAIIEVGDGNSYRHPVQATLNRLINANCYVYQTELGAGGAIPIGKGTVANGTIVVKTSGSNYTVSYGSVSTVYTLPVELTSFTSSIDRNSVRLDWNTASEVNNYGFEIQRRVTGDQDWSKIGFVAGSGTSTAPHHYSFIDSRLQAGRLAYRLKLIDNSGTLKFSQSIDVETVPVAYALSQNFPNPFNPSTTISYSLPVRSRVSIRIVNTLGQTIAELASGEEPPGNQSVRWDSNVAGGIYFCRIDAVATGNPNNRFAETKKMVLLR